MTNRSTAEDAKSHRGNEDRLHVIPAKAGIHSSSKGIMFCTRRRRDAEAGIHVGPAVLSASQRLCVRWFRLRPKTVPRSWRLYERHIDEVRPLRPLFALPEAKIPATILPAKLCVTVLETDK